MLTVTGWRDRLAARRGSAGTHIEASLRAVENCLGGAALLSAILLYLASAGSSPLVVALAALDDVGRGTADEQVATVLAVDVVLA